MNLLKVHLKNFRGYLNTHQINITENFTAFLGKNDTGKSTILEALEIFFNSESVKIDADDLNIHSIDNYIEIGCVFSCLPEKIVIDETTENNLAEEYLLNQEGCLQIIKKYKVQKTVSKPEVYIHALHPSNDKISNLHSLKLDELKKLGKELGVESSVSDQRVSSKWRKALWDGCDNLMLSPVDIDITQLSTDSKKISSKIEQEMPTYALFKSDRESVDSDPEAKNPMQLAVKEAQKELEEEINILQEKIEKSVLEVANRTVEKIKEMDPDLANELSPRFKEKPKWVFNFTIDGDEKIPINKRGSGVRRLVLLNFFRAEAERKQKKNESPNVIYAIEEPETSQHPNYQKMLVSSLLRLSLTSGCQVLITTHVPALAELIDVESIRFIERTDSSTIIIHEPSEDTLIKATQSLGILPESAIAFAKKAILVEGHSDIAFLNHISNTYKMAGFVAKSLDDARIYPIPIGGCGNLKHWVTKKIIEKMGIDYCVIMDSDIGDEVQNSRNIKKIEEIIESGKIGILTKKREPENYIDADLIEKHYKTKLSYSETCDAKKIIGSALKYRPEDVLERIWLKMNIENMKKMSVNNGEDEFMEWLKKFEL